MTAVASPRWGFSGSDPAGRPKPPAVPTASGGGRSPDRAAPGGWRSAAAGSRASPAIALQTLAASAVHRGRPYSCPDAGIEHPVGEIDHKIDDDEDDADEQHRALNQCVVPLFDGGQQER